MDSNPVLKLLAPTEEPPFRSFRVTANALAQRPQYLSELLEKDLHAEILYFLKTNSRRLSKVFWTLANRDVNQGRYSPEISALLLGLIEPAFTVLEVSEFQSLICAGLQLCRRKMDRRRLFRSLSACGQGRILVLLTASQQGHQILQEWLLDFDEEDVDANALQVWTRGLAELMKSCPLLHHPSGALECWQKIEALKDALEAVLSDKTSLSSKGKNAEPVFDNEIVKLFMDLDLKVPVSTRMCSNLTDKVHNHTLVFPSLDAPSSLPLPVDTSLRLLSCNSRRRERKY